MDNWRFILLIVCVVLLFTLQSEPFGPEKDASLHFRYLIGRFCQDVSIAIGAFLGWNATRVRGLCPGGLIGVIVGKALNRFLGQESYEIIIPAVITAIAAKLTRNQQLYAVAGFAAWWLFFARTPLSSFLE